MGLSQKVIRRSSGFTILELLVAMTISTLLLVVLGALFRAGFWEVQHSSGRIELIRRGRQAINNTQRYLATAVSPGDVGGETAIAFPPSPLDDDPESRVQFYTVQDHLVNPISPGAREIQESPAYYSYEIAGIPGPNNVGQDLVVRKRLMPTAPTPADLPPLAPDLSVEPKFLVRGLGTPEANYTDGFIVRHNRLGAIEMEINLSSDLISDSLHRNKLENYTPLRIKMTTIYSLPVYNVE